MKKIILTSIIMAFVFTSCNSKNKNEANTSNTLSNKSSHEQMYACHMHPEMMGRKGEKCSKCGMEFTVPVKTTEPVNNPNANSTTNITNTEKPLEASSKSTFSINEIVSNYLNIKNALTKDDSKGASSAGNAMVTTLSKLDTKNLSATQIKSYNDIADDAKENAEHIGANAGKLDHQREHFALLSTDIADLVKIFGSTQKLYQDFCPMYDDNKGVIWISEIKEIKNPYYGSKMIDCGSMKKEL